MATGFLKFDDPIAICDAEFYQSFLAEKFLDCNFGLVVVAENFLDYKIGLAVAAFAKESAMVKFRVSCVWTLLAVSLLCAIQAVGSAAEIGKKETRIAAFALGSFWRGEAVFGCLPGVVRTRAGYAGGLKQSPDYHSVGDHAETVEVEYDPTAISFDRLLEIFWSNHDPSQIFGQGPDVGPQYRSIIFTLTEDERELASARKAAQMLHGKVVMTEIPRLEIFYPAEAEHQKFELRRKPHLLELLGDVSDDELTSSVLATKLNGYAADLCPPNMKKLLDTKVRPFMQTRPTLDQVISF